MNKKVELYYTGPSRLMEFLNKYFGSSLYVQSINHVRPRITSFAELEKHANEGWSGLDLTHFFFKTFGVNVFTEGVLYTFKYEVCVTSEWSPVVLECRGTVAKRESLTEPNIKEWTICSRPFDKFFNQAESECPVMTDDAFAKASEEAYFVEKLDGTCMQLWYCGVDQIKKNYEIFMDDLKWAENNTQLTDVEEIIEEQKKKITQDLESKKQTSESSNSSETTAGPSKSVWTEEEKRERTFWKTRDKSMKRQANKNKGTATAALEMRTSTEEPDLKASNYSGWRVSTLGMITPNNIFQELFWRFFQKSSEVFTKLDQNYTFLFELCCEANKVVTKYDKDRLLLIGARHKITGVNKTYPELKEVQQEFTNIGVDLELPRIENLKQHKIQNIKQAKKWVEDEALQKNVEKMGDVPEGWCLWIDGVPLAKMKNTKYLDKHGIITGNALYVRNIVIKRFWEGTLDDVYSVLSEGMKKFVEELKEKVGELMKEAEKVVQGFRQVLKEKNYWEQDTKKRGAVFAKTVQLWSDNTKNVKSWKGLLFIAKEEIIKQQESDCEIASITMKWLKDGNWKKFEDTWKNTNITEITQAQKIQHEGKD